MDLRQIEFFLKLYEEKNFTKASQKLYISQQGLSKSIYKLEKELGVLLFERSVKGVVPTEHANRLYQYFNDVNRSMCRLNREIDDIRHSYQGELHIVYVVGAMYLIPMDFLIDFQKQYPEIKVVYDEMPEMTSDKLLLTDQYDLGILAGPIDSSLFQSICIYQEKPFIYMHKNHPLAEKSELSFKDLDGQDLLFYTRSHKSRIIYDKLCHDEKSSPNIVFETNNSASMIPLLKKNKGLLLGIPSAIHPFIDSDIIEIPIIWDHYYRLYLSWKRDTPLSLPARLFFRFLDNYQHRYSQK